jgi:hypothetical protein
MKKEPPAAALRQKAEAMLKTRSELSILVGNQKCLHFCLFNYLIFNINY